MKSTQLFPDIVIPECILDAVRSGVLTDISWGNDCAPSFMLTVDALSDNADEALRLYVDHEDQNQREDEQSWRFAVTNAETVMDTNNAEDALAFLVNR